MNIIIACDSFKECLSSWEIAELLAQGLTAVNPKFHITKIPMADGGEGTMVALVKAGRGRVISCQAEDPLLRVRDSAYAILNDNKTVVIEMAQTCSLALVTGSQRNPWHTSTWGVGRQIKDALEKGYRNFIIGLGGTSTNDGGLGLLQCLGYRFYDQQDKLLAAGQGGKQLLQIKRIDTSMALAALAECHFTLASDVTNPFFGSTGAAYIYGPQKGADDEMVRLLDAGLSNFSKVIKQTFNKDISQLPGSGAAGGTAGGLLAFLNCEMRSGTDIILELYNFPTLLETCDLVITGEGKIDEQTLYGKVPYRIGQICQKQQVPVIAVCGRLALPAASLLAYGIKEVYELSSPNTPLQEALAATPKNLYNTAVTIAEKLNKTPQ